MWEVPPEESGTKLITFLQKRLPPHYSARQIKKAIESNVCEVNSKVERFASRSLGSGDKVTFYIEDLPKQTIHFEPNRILFEDSYLLIYNKASGVASDSPYFLSEIKKYCKTIELVHRLDKETSGALIFAKSQAAKEAMIDLFRKFTITKKYLAVIDGVPHEKEGTIDNFLGVKFEYQGQKIWGKVDQGGLHAVTYWHRLAASASTALLLCEPKTGRTHQIRVHLSEMGHPILGDYQYGKKSKSNYHPSRCLLHARSITFIHPFTQVQMNLSSPLPLDMTKAIIDLFGLAYEKISNH